MENVVLLMMDLDNIIVHVCLASENTENCCLCLSLSLFSLRPLWAGPSLPLCVRSFLYFCEWCILLLCDSVVCPLSGFHAGEEVMWLRSYLLAPEVAHILYVYSLFIYIYNLVILIINTVILTCWYILHSQHLLPVCPSGERILLCCS